MLERKQTQPSLRKKMYEIICLHFTLHKNGDWILFYLIIRISIMILASDGMISCALETPTVLRLN